MNENDIIILHCDDEFDVIEYGTYLDDDHDVIFRSHLAPHPAPHPHAPQPTMHLSPTGYLGFFDFFTLKDYLQDIFFSFHTSSQTIAKQFMTDFHRQSIFLNDLECSIVSQAIEFINQSEKHVLSASQFKRLTGKPKLLQKWIMTKNVKDVIMPNVLGEVISVIVMMLMTQAAFAHQFQHLSALYSNVAKEQHVITQRNNRPQVRLYREDGKCFYIMLQNDFQVYDVRRLKTLLYIEATSWIDLEQFPILSDLESPFGILSWKIK